MRVLFILLLLALLAVMALSADQLASSFDHNLIAIDMLEAWVGGVPNPHLETSLERHANVSYASFYLGMGAFSANDVTGAESYWESAIRADPRYLKLVRVMASDSLPLAQTAARTYPEQSLPWSWLGDAYQEDPAAALGAYQQAASLSPLDNLIWEKIGGLAESQGDTELAIHAAGRACVLYRIRNGSCLRAARLSFAEADYESVVHYYELGYYPESAAGWAKLIRAAQHLDRAEDAQAYLRQAQDEYPADYHSLLSELP